MATANKIELARVDELRPYENNARQHSERQIEQIAASIRGGDPAEVFCERDGKKVMYADVVKEVERKDG